MWGRPTTSRTSFVFISCGKVRKGCWGLGCTGDPYAFKRRVCEVNGASFVFILQLYSSINQVDTNRRHRVTLFKLAPENLDEEKPNLLGGIWEGLFHYTLKRQNFFVSFFMKDLVYLLAC